MPIHSVRNADVLATDADIVFAVNVEGFNDMGLARKVAQLTQTPLITGTTEPGNVRTIKHSGRLFHAVTAHSLRLQEWYLDAITSALDEIGRKYPNRRVAVVWMGSGMIGSLQGVDPSETKEAIDASALNCELYYL